MIGIAKPLGWELAGCAAIISFAAWDMLHNPQAYRRIPDGNVVDPNWNNHYP